MCFCDEFEGEFMEVFYLLVLFDFWLLVLLLYLGILVMVSLLIWIVEFF